MRTQPQDIIFRLESTNSRLEKEKIIEYALNEGLPEFFNGLRLALDSLITFGVKEIPVKEPLVDQQGLAWDTFKELVDRLQSRELTGNTAKRSIELCMDLATEQQWNGWYRRILQKDLKCGVSEKTVNKVLKKAKKTDLIIPVFECMLAHDSANHEKKMIGEKLIQTKLDGVRVLTIIYDVNGDRIEMFSRNGKQFHNFDHVIEEIQQVLKNNPLPQPMVLDGEIMSSSFQDLMKQVHRKENVAADDAILYLFDMMPFESFKSGKYKERQIDRSNALHEWVDQYFVALPHVKSLSWSVVDLDTEQGYDEFVKINKMAIDGGYEGVLIKDIDAPYECKRSYSWLKAKPFVEVTLAVEAVEQGTGRNETRLGALVCVGTDNGRDIRVNVGGGFSDNERQLFWDNQSQLIGQMVEIRADAVSQNQDGTYSLRFPRFKTFRGFTPGEII